MSSKCHRALLFAVILLLLGGCAYFNQYSGPSLEGPTPEQRRMEFHRRAAQIPLADLTPARLFELADELGAQHPGLLVEDFYKLQKQHQSFKKEMLPDVKLQSWVGKPIDEFIVKMGAPDSSMPLKDGGQVYTWVSVYGSYTGGLGELPGSGYTSTCRISIVTDSEGIIRQYSYVDC